MIEIHQKDHRKDSNGAEPEAEVSNPSPFVVLDKLVAISLYLRFALANTDCITSFSVCGKKKKRYIQERERHFGSRAAKLQRQDASKDLQIL